MTNEVGEKLQIFAQMSHIRLCQLTPDLFEIEKPLSKREMQIVAWVAVGKSNSEISSILGISENSIDTYMRRAFLKLDVHDRTSAAVKAISMDIVRT
ncbi:helix-turn-helix domain-containing protein [Parasphingorhabdus sp.]